MAQSHNPISTAGEDSTAPPSGLAGLLHGFISFCLEGGIHLWVRLTGRLVRRSDAPWLAGPLGGRERIGTGIYERVAQTEGLLIHTTPNAGLLEHFNVLRGPNFDPDAVHPDIRHFYEHAAEYQLDVWSEVSLIGRFFLWLLVEFISRRMDQLNFPISSLEVAKGMTSEVVQLREMGSGRLAYTGWLRRFRATGKVIYAGLYSVTQVPGEANPCVKVTFPCFGSSNVYLRPCGYADGTFGLVSTGAAFGRSGFYRVVEAGKDAWRVRNFKTLHEIFHVYADEDGILRTDHEITFVGLTILRLHYKMTPAQKADIQVQQEARSSLQPV